MVLPTWATPQHPIGQHEGAMWRSFLRRWWWLGMLPIAFALITGLCGVTGNLPIFIQATVLSNSSELLFFAGFAIVQTLVQSVWNLNASVQWVVGVAVALGSAVTIARERETKNWELLRLTPIPVGEIALAKVVAILRPFLWPILITTAINLIGTLLLGGVLIAGVLALNTIDPTIFTFDLQIAVIAIIVGIIPILMIFIAVNTVLDLAYNTAIGLLASCWATTRANAIALSLVMHFILSIFIMGPLYFLLFIGSSLLAGFLTTITFAPFFIIAGLILGAGLLYIVFRVGMVVAAGFAARHQLQRLTE
jgi:hypothetical protein